MKKNKTLIITSLIIIYLLLKHIIPYGNYAIYPVNLLVTFMHEFGHSFFAVITGGSVDSLKINTDGSGLTTSRGGIRNLIVPGGYIGSAIFGNLLLYISLKKEKLSHIVLYFFAGLMIFTSIYWFSNLVSTILLIILSGALIFIAKKTKQSSSVLQFLAVASILFIIEDFNVGPTSDLANFSTIIPEFIWMIIWLFIVLVISGFNLKLIFKK